MPEYTKMSTTRNPYTPKVDMKNVNLFVCNTCGAVIMSKETHDNWHKKPAIPIIGSHHG